MQASRVAREITRLRKSRSTQWLSDRTHELGYRVSRSMITDLENGRRRYVATHELIVLARALSTSPIDLLYGSDNGANEILPGESVPRLVAIQRFTGIDENVLQEYEEAIANMLAAAESAREGAQETANLLKELRSKSQATDDGR